MREAMIGLSLLISSCYSIYGLKTPQHDNYGQEIVFVTEHDNPYGASASYENGVPTIKYDPQWMGQFPEEFQNFLFYHEVAHFKLGHLDNWNPYVSQEELDELQREADCDSLIYLRNHLYYTFDQLVTIYEFAFMEFERVRVDDLAVCLTTK